MNSSRHALKFCIFASALCAQFASYADTAAQTVSSTTTPTGTLSAPTAPVTSPLGATSTVGSVSSTDFSRTIPDSAAGVAPITAYNLGLAWNETQKTLSLTYTNTSGSSLNILGVQSSGDIFVVDYPATIAPQSTGTISAVYYTQAGSQGGADVVRLLTSDGIKSLVLSSGRPSVATFDSQRLSWQLNESATAKSVTLTLANGVKVSSVRAALGGTASVLDLGNGSFKISVTPPTTTKAYTFPVFVTLTPSVPNVAPVVTCSVGL